MKDVKILIGKPLDAHMESTVFYGNDEFWKMVENLNLEETDGWVYKPRTKNWVNPKEFGVQGDHPAMVVEIYDEEGFHIANM